MPVRPHTVTLAAPTLPASDARAAMALLACMLLACTLAACTPSISRGDFDAPDPASRIYAIERAVKQHDLEAVPAIVESLDSDDPAVRFVAIGALERLTGETYGYAYDADQTARRAAIERWNAALDGGETVPTGATTPDRGATPPDEGDHG